MNYADIPISDSITMRPVWRRHLMRSMAELSRSGLKPPTESEIRDAIRVLEDPENEKYAPALNAEAFRIFEEASQ